MDQDVSEGKSIGFLDDPYMETHPYYSSDTR